MSRVLIVEDETITRSILARVVSTLPGMSALAVGSVREARAALEVASPDIAIVDLHLPDGLGFEVLNALDEKGGLAMAIVTSAHLRQHERELSASRARLRCMAKPIDYSELKRALVAVSSAGVRFHGPFAPVEYVQIVGSGRHRAKLVCYDPEGTPIGAIVVSDGRVWSAQTPRSTGLSALRELVARSDARVRLEAAPEPHGPANVDRNWQVAVLHAMTPEALAVPTTSAADDSVAVEPPELALSATGSVRLSSSDVR